jgi:hypothetical protein
MASSTWDAALNGTQRSVTWWWWENSNFDEACWVISHLNPPEFLYLRWLKFIDLPLTSILQRTSDRFVLQLSPPTMSSKIHEPSVRRKTTAKGFREPRAMHQGRLQLKEDSLGLFNMTNRSPTMKAKQETRRKGGRKINKKQSGRQQYHRMKSLKLQMEKERRKKQEMEFLKCLFKSDPLVRHSSRRANSKNVILTRKVRAWSFRIFDGFQFVQNAE